ncbi:hypothetical protein TrST_g3111 [Triparma strigata]|uniref:Uncharacterized protein n=1 Tax=Triparma strigata TaxID=1606541 RepID=A0A9W7BKB0_9STRA|nr:hypothetical protein TrST_g3111 [Triparma strigata]
MLENLKRQCSVRPLTPSEKSRTLSMMLELQSMYFQDPPPADSQSQFEDVTYWTEEIANGLLHIANPHSDVQEAGQEAVQEAGADGKEKGEDVLMDKIETDGYHISPPPQNTPKDLSFAINHTLSSLSSHGWPPQFLLLYDEIWSLLSSTISSHYTSLGPSLLLESDTVEMR